MLSHFVYRSIATLIAERQLIKRFRNLEQSKNSKVKLGIGDDCAVLSLPPGNESLVTTDFSLEGVHFRRDWQSPECIGHRCLTRGLSDIAAMGGTPAAAFLSLALPAKLPQKWVDQFFAGLIALAQTHRIPLAGGDIAESPGGVLADIMIVGGVRSGRALLRSGARPGDLIYVTGDLGESAAALHLLQSGRIKHRDVFPHPRVEVGEWLVQKEIATSAIDISDGLSTDLSHICEESGVGAALESERIPIHISAQKLSRKERSTEVGRRQSQQLALHGGEDYELLFTAPKSKLIPQRIAGVKVTRIGEVLGEKKMYVMQNGKRTILIPQGWQYFTSTRGRSAERS